MRKLLVVLFTMLFLMGITTTAYAAYSGMDMPTTKLAQPYTAPLESGNWEDNGIGNANASGRDVEIDDGSSAGEVIKSDDMLNSELTGPATQRTHGEYQLNTNSCASCHQTHTGASKDLLIKAGVYNTCTACHDGTLGFYNVFTGSSAGTFGGTAMGNASVHIADGSQLIKVAPGGFADFTAPEGTTMGDYGAWSENFDCASCHAPHGSYSDRILHYNPNGMGNIPTDKKGQKLVQIDVVDVLPAASETSPAFVGYRADGKVVVMERVQNADKTYSYKQDTTPWLYGYEFKTINGARTKVYYTSLYDVNGAQMHGDTTEYTYGGAFVSGDIAAATKMDVARVYVVKLGIKDAATAPFPATQIADFGGVPILAVDEEIYDEAGYGVAIGKYCGACHTDYRAKSGTGTGMYTVAFRHTTDNDGYTCLKCHFAHGTDVEIMKDAKDRTVASLVAGGADQATAEAYMVDKNPSSALKRYTNMAVCWKCHTDSKASQLKNNDYYWSGANVPHGPNNW